MARRRRNIGTRAKVGIGSALALVAIGGTVYYLWTRDADVAVFDASGRATPPSEEAKRAMKAGGLHLGPYVMKGYGGFGSSDPLTAGLDVIAQIGSNIQQAMIGAQAKAQDKRDALTKAQSLTLQAQGVLVGAQAQERQTAMLIGGGVVLTALIGALAIYMKAGPATAERANGKRRGKSKMRWGLPRRNTRRRTRRV